MAYVCQQPLVNMPPSPSTLHDGMLPPASSTQQPPPSATCSGVAPSAFRDSRPVFDTHTTDAACTDLIGRSDAAREPTDESNQESLHSGSDSQQQVQRGLRAAQSESSIFWTGVARSHGKGNGGLMHQALQAKQLPPGHYVMY